MTFSIIIPVFNRKNEISNLLSSISKLEFSKTEFEVIVVDDCSNDGTEKLENYDNIKFIKLVSKKGPASARNIGINFAKGEYIFFMDSDCEPPKNILTCLKTAYEHFPKVCGVGGNIVNDGEGIFEQYETLIYNRYISRKEEYISTKRDEFPFALGNMSYKKSVLTSFGGFNENHPFFVSGEDALLKEKLLKQKCTFLFIPVTVIHKRRYSFRSFIRQSEERGAGMLLDSKRHGKFQSKLSVFARLLLTPFYLLLSIIKFRSVKFGFVDTLAFVFKNYGKLKYYRVVRTI